MPQTLWQPKLGLPTPRLVRSRAAENFWGFWGVKNIDNSILASTYNRLYKHIRLLHYTYSNKIVITTHDQFDVV